MANYLEMFIDPDDVATSTSAFAKVLSYTGGTWKGLLRRISNSYPMPPSGYDGRLFRLSNGYIYYAFKPCPANTNYAFSTARYGNSIATSTTDNSFYRVVDGNSYFVSRISVFELESQVSNPVYTFDTLSTNNLDTAIRTLWGDSDIPITYYLTNCSAPSAPTSVSPGGVVTFAVTVSPGYNIFNPVQGGSISVYQGDNYIPFTYENGVLRFTAPGGG